MIQGGDNLCGNNFSSDYIVTLLETTIENAELSLEKEKAVLVLRAEVEKEKAGRAEAEK